MGRSSRTQCQRQCRSAASAALARAACLATALSIAAATCWPKIAFASPAVRPQRLCRDRVLLRRAGGGASPLWVPDRRVVEIVEDHKGKVTKADVLRKGASAAGLERELLQLARASGASLRVSDKGELMYEFPSGLSTALARSSRALWAQQVLRRASSWLSRAGRVAFGVSLLATCAVLAATVIVLLASDEKSDDSSSSSSSSSYSFDLIFGDDPWFWFKRKSSTSSKKGKPEMSFLESVFSFVFGDGDPNERLMKETRWQLIGALIAQNGGAVVADQVAPYLDPVNRRDGERELHAAMLPVLLRFRGRVEVGSKGEMVYVFPEMQESSAVSKMLLDDISTEELKRRLSAMGKPTKSTLRETIVREFEDVATHFWWSRGAGAATAELPAEQGYMVEAPLKFSKATSTQIWQCIAYGVFAVLATVYIGTQIRSGRALVLAKTYGFLNLVLRYYPFFAGYVASFFAIPALRWFRLRAANKAIFRRNEWRAQQAKKLVDVSPTSTLAERLASAASWAKSKISFGKAVYDSSTSAASDLDEFDQKLGEPQPFPMRYNGV